MEEITTKDMEGGGLTELDSLLCVTYYGSYAVACDVTFLDVRHLGDMHTVLSGHGEMGHL